MPISIQSYMQERGEWISSHLLSFLPPHTPKKLHDSMRYSLAAGGKRLRPILLIATLESLGKPKELGLEVASAIEMIHTYSLIHDDLPAMDNDDFRRGVPTNHKVYGEGIAILAGDALLTYAFELIASLGERDSDVSPKTLLHLIKQLALAVGPEGMVGGQLLDLEGEKKQLSLEELEQIHRHKTGDLIHFSVYAGAILGGATPTQLEGLSEYARKIGLAFQIQDDVLDIIGEKGKMGKASGSDESRGKTTYPSLLGLEKARERVSSLVSEAKEALKLDGIDDLILAKLAEFMIWREY